MEEGCLAWGKIFSGASYLFILYAAIEKDKLSAITPIT